MIALVWTKQLHTMSLQGCKLKTGFGRLRVLRGTRKHYGADLLFGCAADAQVTNFSAQLDALLTCASLGTDIQSHMIW